MAEKKFTNEQLSAIETRNKTLLVSAAAGSGKTATLTERIIRSLTDESSPEDISRMLIVTFTNAAVKELRDRITAALEKKLAENKDNKRLETQLYMLPSARISTIDSFCNDILKNNTEKFGISPKYRIADPIEAKILSHSVWSALIDAIYSGELTDVCTAEQLEELASCLTGVKSDSELEEILEILYSKSKSHEDGAAIFRRFTDKMGECRNLPIEENIYASYAMNRTKEAARHYAAVLRKLSVRLWGEESGLSQNIAAVKENIARRDEIKRQYSGKKQRLMLEELPDLSYDDKYLVTLDCDIAVLTAVANAKSYTEMQAALNMPFSALPSVKGEKTEPQLQVGIAREAMKKALAKAKERYFTYNEEEWRAHIEKLYELLTVLSALIEKFDGVYFEEKKSRAMLEYSDIERLTYLSLYDGDGKPSELALALREEFSSVYIDEYQDVNSLQNKIFLAVSRENNRFTVGDIKQSIYGFRSARPDIFADMKKSYPDLCSADNSDTASIFMSKNFRCDEEIIDFVNSIFDKMFALVADSIGYVKEDRLSFAKIYENGVAPGHKLPTVRLFPKSDTQDGYDEDGDEKEDEDSEKDPEPKWVAAKIRELIDGEILNSGEPICPSDIAIVLRKGGKRAQLYADALSELGIKSRAPENKNFFLNAEIQLVLCLLNSINNPMKDIYLAGIMLSPIFDFTADELYFARSIGNQNTLWESVLAYSEAHPEYTKFASFISTLNGYRSIAEGMRVDALLMRLYNDCGLIALAAKDGTRENLMLLYNYARKFESSSFEGLYNFIRYVNTVIESGAEFASGKENESENAVTIITVHKSKGLEYPIVFLADAATDLISKNERRSRVAYSDEYGIAMRTRVPGGLALVSSPIYNAIIDKNTDMSVEEELRVYYVALTRARERLYITGSPKVKTKEDYIASSEAKRIHESPYTLYEMRSFVDILHAVDTNAIISWQDEKSYTDTDFPENSTGGATERDLNTDKEAQSWSESSTEYGEELYATLTKRFSYEYPNRHLTTLPEKMSVSNLYPTVLDGTEEEPRLTIDEISQSKKQARARLPEFISGSSDEESARRGIATHNFLQFFDIPSLDALGPSAELERLCQEKFISPDNKNRVRLSEIELFFNSELYRQMKSAKKLYREFRFSVMLPAALFTANEEKKTALGERKILLQGVIDCIIEDEYGRLHLVDYKTDRLTKAELSDKSLAKKALSAKHSLQLSYYAKAIERIFGKAPTTVRVYSLPLGDTVDV